MNYYKEFNVGDCVKISEKVLEWPRVLDKESVLSELKKMVKKPTRIIEKNSYNFGFIKGNYLYRVEIDPQYQFEGNAFELATIAEKSTTYES